VNSFSIKQSEIKKDWLVIDAKDLVLGRLASEVAMILRGKNKPIFTPHMDCGDNVIIVNASQVKLTGNKSEKKSGKIYYRHTGFPGGIKHTTAGKLLEGKFSDRVIKLAVKRMLPGNKLCGNLFKNLFVYSGSEHPHEAQKPRVHNIVKKKYNEK
jgi:large subunit ribosomal protein L13